MSNMKLCVFTLETCQRKVIKSTVVYYRLKVLVDSNGGLWEIGDCALETLEQEFLTPNGITALRIGEAGGFMWAEADGTKIDWADWFTSEEMEAARAAADASEIEDVALGWKTVYLIWNSNGEAILQTDDRILPDEIQPALNVLLNVDGHSA